MDVAGRRGSPMKRSTDLLLPRDRAIFEIEPGSPEGPLGS